ncbi:hypothetical protein UCDDA912_g08782 [Diaporthe ampelina]|uniref:Uncharacterized protein n=1 Tax=Diaporthe ampelina TaxID=1214573 RepID=A0A0G2FAT1_9PEZI|nr:hypothetical protein UCDDA912_g08782 [Diaporthe ampelina]
MRGWQYHYRPAIKHLLDHDSRRAHRKLLFCADTNIRGPLFGSVHLNLSRIYHFSIHFTFVGRNGSIHLNLPRVYQFFGHYTFVGRNNIGFV